MQQGRQGRRSKAPIDKCRQTVEGATATLEGVKPVMNCTVKHIILSLPGSVVSVSFFYLTQVLLQSMLRLGGFVAQALTNHQKWNEELVAVKVVAPAAVESKYGSAPAARDDLCGGIGEGAGVSVGEGNYFVGSGVG